jgi:hypothetical protein
MAAAAEPELVRDQLQDRLVRDRHVADVATACVRRDRHARDPETGHAEALVEIGAGEVVRYEAGRDMIEEATPLVVVDEHRAALELRRGDERVDDVGHERLADPDVAMRVFVA